MQCEACHGSGSVGPLPIPCGDCGGSGVAHCCDGIREQLDPGDETPEAMGCADDCCHPDHGHGVREWVGKDGLSYTNRYGGVTNIDALEPLAGRAVAMYEAKRRWWTAHFGATEWPTPGASDTHDEWRELNDAE